MRSLRRSIIRGIYLWVGIGVVLCFFLLLTVFQNYSQRRFDQALASHHRQVVIALADTRGDPDLLQAYLTYPDFRITLSGLYWQVEQQDGTIITSPSTAFETIEHPQPDNNDLETFEGVGPDGRVRGMHQQITLDDGSVWTVIVAQSLAVLERDRKEVGSGFVLALIVAAAIGLIGVGFQMRFILRPLTLLRSEVADRWQAGEALKTEAFPIEVSPLIEDINTLLTRNRGVVDSARRQAADLAHALKTPTAVIRNVLERPKRGAKDIGEAKEALDRIDAQILRSLARIRAGNAAAMAYRTNVRISCERLARFFNTMRGKKTMTVSVEVPEDLAVMMDQQDLEEVLGNLFENALKYGGHLLRVSASVEDEIVAIFVDDDGPGVPEERRTDVLHPGRRLDVSAPGSGLGLAIANDLVKAYGGGIELDTAPDLGGLRIVILLPQIGTLRPGGDEEPATEG